jgi:DNA-binding transcriptional MerR regulator
LSVHGPDEPVYTIGVVARLLEVRTQTLRVFEREGLLLPSRTEANMRLYTQNELLLLRRICSLMRDEGVNIPGVRTVLRIEGYYESLLAGEPAQGSGGAGEDREKPGPGGRGGKGRRFPG